MLELIIAESFPMLLETMHSRLSRLSLIEHIISCSNEKQLKQLFQQKEPDLLILSLEIFQQEDPVNFCAAIVQDHPNLKILLFTDFADSRLMQQYFKVGIRGYLPRQAQPQELVRAIEVLTDGQIYLPDFFRRRLVELNLGLLEEIPSRLTSREKEVLKLIIDEYTTKEIAEKLYISSATAETHRIHLIQKLGVRNTAGLVRESLLKGLHI